MLQSIFDTAQDATTTAAISLSSVLITMAAAFILGIIISLVYMKTHEKGCYSQSFVITLVMLPVIISLIILLIGSNVARAFSLAGAFSIIRFRSSMGDPKDISYVFLTMAIGLALGVGFAAYAFIFTIILSLFMFIMYKLKFGGSTKKQLRIVIPEDLDYQNAFTDIFVKYTLGFKEVKVKTIDLGSLFEIYYSIDFKDGINEKDFIDELRCRNSNLSIILQAAPTDE